MSRVDFDGDVTKEKTSAGGFSRRQFIQISAAAGGTAAFLAACTAAGVPVSAPSGDAASTAAEGVVAQEGGTIIWMGHQEVAGLSPNDTGPTVQWFMISQIHQALMQVDTSYVAQPVLAESYEVSDDGLTFTFKLRDGITFHNGQPFTSEDVKYTYEFYRDAPDSAQAGALAPIESIDASDPLTVVITLSEINADFINNAATVYIVPHAYHAEVGQDVYSTAPIGTGPYKLLEWVAADHTTLEKNEDFWGGVPKIDFIRQNVVPEPAVRAIALETGEAHVSVWPLLVDDSLRLRDEGFQYFATPAGSVRFIPINNRLPQLSDKNVRKAILMGIDRHRIINELWKGIGSVALSTYTPAGVTYYNADIPEIPFDPEGAMAMLDEAGWVPGADGIREKDGVRLSFTVTTITGDQARRPIAELSAQLVKEIGVEMLLAEAPVATILEALPAGDMDASLFNWTFGDPLVPDPYDTLHTNGANNFMGYSNPVIDDLIERGRTTIDTAERAEIYKEIQAIVADEVPALFLMFDEWIYIMVPGVEGPPDPASISVGDYMFPNAYTWTIPQNG